MADKVLTYGERAVGLTFNPSGDANVDRIKRLSAMIIDICNQLSSSGGERGILAIEAIRQTQTAQMWAVKAATWRDD